MESSPSPHRPSSVLPKTNPHHHKKPSTSVLHKLSQNLAFRSIWGELNGAMGDLGTYIPIIIALTLSRDLDLGTTLIFTGLYNVITGALYGVPMPVEPMKSIAALAIASAGTPQAEEFGVPEMMAAGICTSGALLLFGATGLMKLIYKFIPLCVVRGIQLSQGLSFALNAVEYVRKVQDFSQPKYESGEKRGWLGLDGLILSIFCACFIVIVSGSGEKEEEAGEEAEEVIMEVESDDGNEMERVIRKVLASFPSAFLVFSLGVVLAFIRKPKMVHEIELGPSRIEVVKISKQAWKAGFLKGTIPQLPLSVLNSVIAVCKLSNDLFPRKRLSATSVSVTVGLMNLVGCWFGAMPCCHGAGGLAGQYKFGGRSGTCVVILGVVKLGLGLGLGSSLVVILREFPVGVLGVLLLFAGIELAMASRDVNSKEDAFVMLVCSAVSLVGSSTALGFLCGIVVHLLLKPEKVVIVAVKLVCGVKRRCCQGW